MRLSAYIRVSRVGGRAGESFISPDLQRSQIADWARLRGVEIVNEHVDLDQTGGKLSRPGLNRAMAEVRAGVSDGLAVARIDRLSRAGVADALRLVDELHGYGGKLAAVDLGIDPTTPFGEFALTIMLALARMQRQQTAATWEESRRRAVARGVHIASRPPTGYAPGEDGRLEPSDAAPVIRRVFEAAARGASWGQMAKILEGTPTPYGSTSWTGRSIANLIANPVYLGEARSGDFRLADAHEPLIDVATWRAAQREPGERAERGKSLLAGILRCAGCRYVMKPDRMTLRSGERVRSYRCRGTRPHGECPARAAVLGTVIEPWVIERFFAEAGEVRLRAISASRELGDAERKMAAAIAERDAYRDSTAIAVIGQDAYLAGLEQRQAKADADAERVERLRFEAGIAELGGEDELRAAWETMDVGERRHVLSSSIDAVFVKRTGQANVPIADRATILWPGQGPDDLPGPGRRLGAIRSFDF